jgi:2-keto-4-pentenoate hydratase/2-oxohepta-3-ene-1,7-dioic acid hydratase in catechol pathway
MRLATFGEDFRPGVVVDGGVVDVSPALGAYDQSPPEERILDLIEHFDELKPELERLRGSSERQPLDSVRLRAPVPRPGKIFAAIGNFLEHGARPVQAIDWFFKSPESIIGPGDTIILPPHPARIFHYETELGVVIGRRCRNVVEADTANVIFGYTAFMDISARDLGRPGIATFLGKSFDTFGPMGPWLATADEIADLYAESVRISLNGAPQAEYPLSDMGQRVPALVAHASAVSTLFPGDLLACGTNHQGLGAIQDGDEVGMEITGLGSFTVKVHDPLRRRWPRGVDEEFAERIRAGTAGQRPAAAGQHTPGGPQPPGGADSAERSAP